MFCSSCEEFDLSVKLRKSATLLPPLPIDFGGILPTSGEADGGNPRKFTVGIEESVLNEAARALARVSGRGTCRARS